MKLTDWFPYVIACGNVGSVLFTRNGSKHGWTLVILAQLAFIWYANTTGQPGFYVQNVLMIVVAGEALLHWHRTGGPDQLRKAPHVRSAPLQQPPPAARRAGRLRRACPPAA